jgi:hypothetical protein
MNLGVDQSTRNEANKLSVAHGRPLYRAVAWFLSKIRCWMSA